MREVGGSAHVFAHNGYLTGIDSSAAFAMGIDRPVGQTDSELAFCALLMRMRPLWVEREAALAGVSYDAFG